MFGAAFFVSDLASATCHSVARRHAREAADWQRTSKAVTVLNAIRSFPVFMVTCLIPSLIHTTPTGGGSLWGITLPRMLHCPGSAVEFRRGGQFAGRLVSSFALLKVALMAQALAVRAFLGRREALSDWST